MSADVYIGDLDDPLFNWDGKEYSHYVPHNIGPCFPRTASHAAFLLNEKMEKGVFTGKWTTSFTSVAVVNREQIVDYLRKSTT